MTDLPVLREALRDTAERRYPTRRRGGRRRGSVLAVVALGCVLSAVVLSLARDSGRDRPVIDERVATPPTATAAPGGAQVTFQDARRALAEVYSAFRRPSRASDAVAAPREGFSTYELDWEHARRVAADDNYALFAIPGLSDGKIALCIYGQRAGKPAGGSCGAFSAPDARERPVRMKTFQRPGAVYFLLFADGVHEIHVDLKRGRDFTLPVRDNGAVFTAVGLRSITWTTPDGTHHRTRGGI